MNIIKTSLLLSALIALNSPAQADIYKSVNDEGVIECSAAHKGQRGNFYHVALDVLIDRLEA